MAKVVTKRIIKTLGQQKNDMAYIHALLLNQDHGILDSLLPQVLEKYHSRFMAKGRNWQIPKMEIKVVNLSCSTSLKGEAWEQEGEEEQQVGLRKESVPKFTFQTTVSRISRKISLSQSQNQWLK